MSKVWTLEDILYRQRVLSCCGLYTYKLDGKWGEQTDAADQQFAQASDKIASELGTFDARTERNIRTLRLAAQRLCRQSLEAIRASGLDARLISGTRSYAEQSALFRQGRFGNAGPVVTNARAGQSWHNFGLAWDIGLFDHGAYLPDGSDYNKAGALGKVTSVEWGGDWKSFKDKPHFQCPFGATSVSEARIRFESGQKDS